MAILTLTKYPMDRTKRFGGYVQKDMSGRLAFPKEQFLKEVVLIVQVLKFLMKID